MSETKPTPRLDRVLTRVRLICQSRGHGAITELAELLARTPSQVSEYLTTGERKIKRRPNAEMVLAMLEWMGEIPAASQKKHQKM